MKEVTTVEIKIEFRRIFEDNFMLEQSVQWRGEEVDCYVVERIGDLKYFKLLLKKWEVKAEVVELAETKFGLEAVLRMPLEAVSKFVQVYQDNVIAYATAADEAYAKMMGW